MRHIRNLTMVTPPASEPLSLAMAKAHLRVTIDDDDALITVLITVARELVEKEVQRSLVTRTYQLALDRFPWQSPILGLPSYSDERSQSGTYGVIQIPKPPLIAVTSITYQDQNGTIQTLDPSLYQVVSGGVLPGVIAPSYGNYWPNCRYTLGSVQVTYNAGYGDASAVAACACQAMLLAISHFYKNTEAVSETAMFELPMASKWLLSTLKWGSYQ